MQVYIHMLIIVLICRSLAHNILIVRIIFNYSILSLSTSVFFSACEKELLKTAELKCCYVY